MSSLIVNGAIIGIIAVIIFLAVIYTISFQSVTMANDKLSPMIKIGDLVHYETIPITEIEIRDMVVYEWGDSLRISKVTNTGVNSYDESVIEVTDTDSIKSTINSHAYIGKVSYRIPQAGYLLKDSLALPKGIWIIIIIFISPMIIMKLRERSQKLEKEKKD